MIPQQMMARKKKYIGNTCLPTDRSTTTSNSPHPHPPPCLRRSGFAQADTKGEGSRGASPSGRRDLSLLRAK